MKINRFSYIYSILNGIHFDLVTTNTTTTTTTTNAIEFPLGGSSPYISPGKTNKNKYT